MKDLTVAALATLLIWGSIVIAVATLVSAFIVGYRVGLWIIGG